MKLLYYKYNLVTRVTNTKIEQNMSNVIILAMKNSLIRHLNAKKKSRRKILICALTYLESLYVIGLIRSIYFEAKSFIERSKTT